MEEEKRVYVRYVRWFPVTLSPAEGTGPVRSSSRPPPSDAGVPSSKRLGSGKIGAICRDASTGGMLVSSPVLLETDRRITCSFRISLQDSIDFSIEGRVVRGERNVDDLELVFPFRIAISFEPPLPDIEERLKNAQASHR